jgi:predicted aldo/keto reductase-like oxidoreductase
MEKHLSRRNFIKASSTAAVAISAGGIFSRCTSSDTLIGKNGMPMRVLGKTGQKISILGYGCGSQFLKMPDGEWESHFEHAFNAGINYFDTASSYGGGNGSVSSEERLGRIVPAIRKDIFLLTKIHERDPDKARAEFERSLERMKTDHVDALLIHAIQPEDDVKAITEGVYKLVSDLKAQKMVKFIGFSSMDSAERSKELIEKLDFDLTLLAMNATKYGDFVKVTLPAAREKNVGVISMKIMRNIIDKGVAKAGELLQYNWDLPGVAVNLVSQTGMAPLEENLNVAKNYGKNLVASLNRKELESRLAHLKVADNFDWARPGYYDGMMC